MWNVCFEFLCIAIIKSLLCQCTIINDTELQRFVSTLETYSSSQNEAVFVLDESGSIGKDKFPGVVYFTEMVAHFLSLSEKETRAAIITYDGTVRTIINFIKVPLGNNMCTFLSALPKIIYHAGSTHTGDALAEAQAMLRDSRPESNRLIILMTDGQSNGGRNVYDIANKLKRDGVIIFAVGIATINVDEINKVATSSDHIYFLKDLEYIFTLNKRLRKDIVETEWDYVSDSSLCSSPCDKNAECRCGTRGGHRECVCKPGFQGQGGVGYCYACPNGTYKDKIGVSNCKQCPGNSTTAEEGSTSIHECKCLLGFEGFPQNDKPCIAVRCAKLSPPQGGITIPSVCGNSFGSACNFKCNEGYCPFSCNTFYKNGVHPWNVLPKESRQCLQDGLWTGTDFHCEKIKCPSFNSLEHGRYTCSKSDFTFGTICDFTCDAGFSLIGSPIRECLASGSWNGKETFCKAHNCPPLKTNQKLGLTPKECSMGSMKYQSICQYHCRRGYKLKAYKQIQSTVGERICLTNGSWANFNEELYCEDIEPPSIICPESIKQNADPGKSSASVLWPLPTVHDNVAVDFYEVLYPRRIRKPPATFLLGPTKVVYEVRDVTGLRNTCSFTVSVIDKEPPRITYCPADIEVMHDKNTGVQVFWDLPKFEDNSGIAQIVHVSRQNGSRFYWGLSSNVTYKIADGNKNVAYCKFHVKVKAYTCPYMDPPTNGYLVCDKWSNGQLCSVSCQPGYKFTAKPEDIYFCSQRTQQWTKLRERGNISLPWPDCANSKDPHKANGTASIVYSVKACDDKAIEAVKREFIELAKKRRFCPPRLSSCGVHNVNVTCKLPVKPSRVKRTISNMLSWEFPSLSRKSRQSTEGATLTVKYNFDVTSERSENISESCQNCSEVTSNELLGFGSDVADTLKTELGKVVETEYKQYTPINIETVKTLSLSCEKGSMLINNSCVSCPRGTYFNENLLQCMSCPKNHYQDHEGSLSCKSCPPNTETTYTASKSLDDCKGPCKPGFYSTTGFEQCQSCQKGYYAEESGSTSCSSCPSGTSTSIAGADSPLKCAYPCKPGTNSSDGFQPCTPCPRGTYEPKQQSISCIKCPHSTTTIIEGAYKSSYCQNFHFCDDYMPCLNGSTCVELNNDYRCECPKGFTGKDCQSNVNDCDIDACLNNGTCADGVDSFTCFCPDGFSGFRCEINIDDCKPGLCQNGGSCEDLITDYVCHCAEGFSGRNCEINIDDCASNPCLNNGVCFDSVDGFRCCCPKGLTGHICDTVIDYCSDTKCSNNGTCYSGDDGFNCSCQDGFQGRYCEIDIDECASNPCQNGGTCIDGIANITCHCPDIFFGSYCENQLPLKFGLKFPSPPVTSNFVTLANTRLLFEITVSFFMRTDYTHNRGTPVSYTTVHPTQGFKDNVLSLMDVNELILYLHGTQIDTEYVANADNNWHHYALTWKTADGSWAFYVDGNLTVAADNLEKGGFIYPGMFVLGQDQDIFGGGFSTIESFVGEISEFNVWDYSFTANEVKDLSKSRGFHGNVIKWPVAKTQIHGNVAVEDNFDLYNGKECSPESCHCGFNFTEESQDRDYHCKHKMIGDCTSGVCENGFCASTSNECYCLCFSGFDGRYCEYDINECLQENGKCQHMCVNTFGSYSCECNSGMILSEDGHTCIEESICIVGDIVYSNGDKWEHGHCEECMCNSGNVNCSQRLCPNITCNSYERLTTLPGQCCPICIEGTSCTLKADELTTFDGQIFDFGGQCQYKLASNALTNDFGVIIQSFKKSNNGCRQALTVRVMCSELAISKNGSLSLNNEDILSPYEDNVFFIDSQNSNEIMIETNLGIHITWNCNGYIRINIPSSYKKQLSGLCGNFNDDFSDDLSNHKQSSVVTDFIKKWEISKSSACHVENNGRQKIGNLMTLPTENKNIIDLREKNPWIGLNCGLGRKRKQMIALCQSLWKKHFVDCHKYVDPTVYYISCLQEMCRCRPRGLCYCEPILLYAIECTRKGNHINSDALVNSVKRCRKYCPFGQTYNECGPSCPATCTSKENDGDGCEHERCIPGCYCAENNVLNRNNTCISIDKCTDK